ncbi:MAG: FG-GAP-like repeat-containing protein [Thermoanaerobaculales bacterium]
MSTNSLISPACHRSRRIVLIVRSALAALLLAATLGFAAGCGRPGPDQRAVAENNRGVGLMGQFNFGSARAVFADLAERYPEHPDILTNLAIATLNRQQPGDDRLALEILDRVLEIDPGHLRSLYCRGLILLYMGDVEPALSCFEDVIAGDPGDADAAYNVGQCLMQLEKPDVALQWYERAIELDPYLRSAYYRSFQALQRLGERERARTTLGTFQSLADNPRARLVEFKYTKMGKRGAAAVISETEMLPIPPPAGPLFAAAEPAAPAALPWRGETDLTSITAADIDGDEMIDIFLPGVLEGPAGAVNAVLLQRGDGFELDPDHPLAKVPDVAAVLWGDIDNDGRTDAYLCRRGPNQLWRNTGDDWEDITESSGTSGGDQMTVDGALVDADHDGDLDIFLVNADGPDELLNNNRDGSFRPLAEERGLAGEKAESRQVVFADLDGDRDADIVVRHASPPHEVFENQLLWEYQPAAGFEELRAVEMTAIVAGDVDGDGRTELYTADGRGAVRRWRPDQDGVWRNELLKPATEAPIDRLALTDLSGDGALELVLSHRDSLEVLNPLDGTRLASIDGPVQAWALASLDPGRGPSLVAWAPGLPPQVHRPGPGRHLFVTLKLTGREDTSDALRSNASGIGNRIAMRAGSRWTVVDTMRSNSGPGQSLQPTEIGAGGRQQADFVSIDWSDGVFQTELDLAAGTTHVIAEAQRQLSSCPVLFAWNGLEYAFISDILGVGGIGYAIGPGEYGEPRPWENFLLPEGLPAARDGVLAIKITEPMEEATYLDAARMVAYDLAPGWSMVLDERMAVAGPEPSGAPVFFRREWLPVEAHDNRGEDVTESVASADLVAAPVGELDDRFIGLLAGENILTLRFSRPLNELGSRLILIADGWVEYPYSQTNFAAWQAGRSYDAPTLEARGADGRWQVILEEFGYPAGMPRRMSVPLPPLPEDTFELRLRTNQEIYWDRIAVAAAETNPEMRRQELALVSARLSRTGFAYRTTGPQRLPGYDYGRRAPLWDTRVQAGWYTRLGDISELLDAADDALAIFGPGEEVHFEFTEPQHAVPAGWRRMMVLETDGWCKDMDFYTRDGETLEPLPARGVGANPRSAKLNRTYNTRYLDGRE